MGMGKQNENEYVAIDLLHILKSLWHRAWALVLAAVVFAVVGFCYASYGITPQYSSQVMLYVNNKSSSDGNSSSNISSADISASKNLVETYIVILKNRTTLEEIIEKAQLPYTYEQLSGMLTAASVNTTEVMSVTATSADPYEAAKIANCVAEVLPGRISAIIEGSSMEVVDVARVNLNKVSPSISHYTMMGFALGLLAAALVVAVLAILDNTIHDEDYVLKTYDFPLLAVVPNLTENRSEEYGYRYGGKKQ